MDAAIVSKELLTRFDDNLVQSGIVASSQLASFEDTFINSPKSSGGGTVAITAGMLPASRNRWWNLRQSQGECACFVRTAQCACMATTSSKYHARGTCICLGLYSVR